MKPLLEGTIGSLFSGIGGLDMGLEWHGYRTIWHAEIDPNASRILAEHYPTIPNLGDLTAVDWSTVERPEILAGGFPCQDISNAGKREGINGKKSGLWAEYERAIRSLRPRFVFVENAAALRGRGIDRVLGDLAALGFDAEWGCIRASDACGACHRRDRMFIVASDPNQQPRDEWRLAASRETQRGGTRANPGRSDRTRGVDEIELLPTPSASTYGSNQGGGAGRVGPIRHGLGSIGKLLPTSTVNDSRNGRNMTANRKSMKPTTQLGTTLSDVAHLVDWGKYEAAIERWERLFRAAPSPHIDGRLSADFVEWMMGLPEGWTAIEGVSKTARIKALGNAVVPHHAFVAWHLLGGPSVSQEHPDADSGGKGSEDDDRDEQQEHAENVVVKAAHTWRSNAELIEDVVRLGYIKPSDRVLDPTYGRGTWWKKYRPERLHPHDLAIDGVDFRALPYRAGLFDVVAFDPPYVAVGGRKTSTLGGPAKFVASSLKGSDGHDGSDFHNRYGLHNAPTTPAGLQELIDSGLVEIDRVTRPGGLVFVRVMDYISSGKFWPGELNTMITARSLGWFIEDKFVMVAQGLRPQPKHGRQKHARRNLSALFVFRKPR